MVYWVRGRGAERIAVRVSKTPLIAAIPPLIADSVIDIIVRLLDVPATKHGAAGRERSCCFHLA